MFSRVYVFIDSVHAVYNHVVTEVSVFATNVGDVVVATAKAVVEAAELAVDGVFATVRGK